MDQEFETTTLQRENLRIVRNVSDLDFDDRAPVLVVAKNDPHFPKLLFEDAVLFNQISDHARLVTVNPASERSQQEPKMHGFNHAESISDR